MPWYWVLYWLANLLAIGLSVAMIISGIRKSHERLMRGLVAVVCSIAVPVVSFQYCIGRDFRTSEFERIGRGLLSGSPVAYFILVGYGFVLYACGKTIREGWILS